MDRWPLPYTIWLASAVRKSRGDAISWFRQLAYKCDICTSATDFSKFESWLPNPHVWNCIYNNSFGGFGADKLTFYESIYCNQIRVFSWRGGHCVYSIENLCISIWLKFQFSLWQPPCPPPPYLAMLILLLYAAHYIGELPEIFN
jgi:hypothetical protein